MLSVNWFFCVPRTFSALRSSSLFYVAATAFIVWILCTALVCSLPSLNWSNLLLLVLYFSRCTVPAIAKNLMLRFQSKSMAPCFMLRCFTRHRAMLLMNSTLSKSTILLLLICETCHSCVQTCMVLLPNCQSFFFITLQHEQHKLYLPCYYIFIAK